LYVFAGVISVSPKQPLRQRDRLSLLQVPNKSDLLTHGR
jgi:hypothetical protein